MRDTTTDAKTIADFGDQWTKHRDAGYSDDRDARDPFERAGVADVGIHLRYGSSWTVAGTRAS